MSYIIPKGSTLVNLFNTYIWVMLEDMSTEQQGRYLYYNSHYSGQGRGRVLALRVIRSPHRYIIFKDCGV